MCNGRKARIQVKRSLNFKGCHGHARGDPLSDPTPMPPTSTYKRGALRNAG